MGRREDSGSIKNSVRFVPVPIRSGSVVSAPCDARKDTLLGNLVATSLNFDIEKAARYYGCIRLLQGVWLYFDCNSLLRYFFPSKMSLHFCPG